MKRRAVGKILRARSTMANILHRIQKKVVDRATERARARRGKGNDRKEGRERDDKYTE